MKEDKFDNMYEGRFDALQKKYEAEIAIAKTELRNLLCCKCWSSRASSYN